MADPTVIQGTTGVYGSTGDLAARIELDVTDKLTKLGAPIAPLLRLSRAAGKVSHFNQKFTVLEDARIPRFQRINAGTLTDVTTTITVDFAYYARPNDVWEISRTGEHVLVTATPTSSTWTVVRGYGTTAAAALLNDDELVKIGVALPSGGSAVKSVQTTPTSRERYLQFFSGTADVEEIQTHTNVYGQPELDRQIDNTRDDFLLSVETSMLFGQPLLDADNNSPKDAAVVNIRATAAGLKYEIDTNASSNVLNCSSGVLTQDDMWDWVNTVTTDAPNNNNDGKVKYMLLAGSKVVNIINKWQLQFVQPAGFDSTFGPNLATYQTPHGALDIMKHPLLKGDRYNTYAFMVHKDYVKYGFLQGMDMKVKPNVQDNDSHTRKDEIYGVIGLQTYLPSVHGYLKGASYAG